MHPTSNRIARRFASLVLALACAAPAIADPFTFRGELEDGSAKAQGRYALKLTLYGYEASKVPLAGPLELLDVAVTDGRFAVGVDFGPLPLHLAEGWLDVAVKAADESGDYVALGARSPVALKASEVCPAAWSLSGNALTNPALNFLGTTDAQPFVLRAKNRVIARFEWPPEAASNGDESPNVILGDPSNGADPGVIGATIGGGGGLDDLFGPTPNRVSNHYGTIGGGLRNMAAEFATVGGGGSNESTGRASVVGGGLTNHAPGVSAVVPGGRRVTAGGDHSFAAGHRAHVRARVSNGIIGTSEPDTCDDSFDNETCGDEGTFMWADSHNGDFISQGPNQFLIRALGGVGVQPGDGSGQEFANIPEASLHVFDGSAGNVTASTSSIAVFEASGPAFLSLLTPNASERGLLFGDDVSNVDGGIVYDVFNRLQFRTNGNAPRMTVEGDGDVGIGLAFQPVSNALQVRRTIASINNTPTPFDHVVSLENPGNNNFVSVLALKVGVTSNPSLSNNFVTFYDGDDTPIGSIEGNSGGGVAYSTTGADYAEWLPRQDASEVIAPGDLVGLHPGGTLSKRLDGAIQVLVASTGAAVAGNRPREAPETTHTLVAFIGQVRARICGPVRAGDAILARADGSGCGEAREPKQLHDSDFARLVGTAWEGAPGAGEHRLRIAVGLGDGAATQARWAALRGENTALQARLDTLERDRDRDRAELIALRALIAPMLAAKEE